MRWETHDSSALLNAQGGRRKTCRAGSASAESALAQSNRAAPDDLGRVSAPTLELGLWRPQSRCAQSLENQLEPAHGHHLLRAKSTFSRLCTSGPWARFPTLILLVFSTNAQHGYVIIDTWNNKYKIGVSGQPLNSNGSPRANEQVNEWNAVPGNSPAGKPCRYKAIVKTVVPAGCGAREKILEWESTNAARLRSKGLIDVLRHVKP